MAWSEYEKLQYLGDYGLTISISFDLLKFPKPGNYREPAINTGHSEGTLEFALKFDFLTKSLAGGFDPGQDLGGLQSRADYLWNFFVRHKQAGDKPFTAECEMPGRLGKVENLFVFADDRMDYTLFAARIFSTGLKLEQARVEGAPMGEFISGENPLEI